MLPIMGCQTNGGNKNNINTRLEVHSILYPSCNPSGNTIRLINAWSVRREKKKYAPAGKVYILYKQISRNVNNFSAFLGGQLHVTMPATISYVSI